VFYLRRQIHETPRFAVAGGAHEEAQAAIADATGVGAGKVAPGESAARRPVSIAEGFLELVKNRRLLVWLIGAAGCWMLMDFCYYGNTISQPEILKLADSHASELTTVLLQLAIVAVFAVPGYIVAILLIDRVGRRSIQLLGFAVMALTFLLIGLIPSVVNNLWPFMILYGISYFFTEFGPNMTTFIYPAELFPTEVRTTGHGISAGAGKMGAFIGAFLFPDILASHLGLRGAMVIAGIVAAAGLVLTFVSLPETRGKSLEELTEDAYAAEPGRLRVQPA
jgi:MFS transporter, PHS family, inorganic phosphate transporter